MTLYNQDTDLGLLLELLDRSGNKIVIDVGAEKGAFIEAFVASGASDVFAFEPLPRHAAYLRERFHDDRRIRIYEMAIGAHDATLALHIAEDASGKELDYYHTLRTYSDLPTVRWSRTVPVRCRSLA